MTEDQQAISDAHQQMVGRLMKDSDSLWAEVKESRLRITALESALHDTTDRLRAMAVLYGDNLPDGVMAGYDELIKGGL